MTTDRTVVPPVRRSRRLVSATVLAVVLLGASTACTSEPTASPRRDDPGDRPSATASGLDSAAPVSDEVTPGSTARAASLPTSCDDALPPAEAAEAVGDRPVVELELRDPSDALLPSERPVIEGEVLSCLWPVPGTNVGASVEYSTVDPALADQYLWELGTEGAVCTETLGGTSCSFSRPGTLGAQSPDNLDGLFTMFSRDGVVITVTELGKPSGSLLQALTHRVWS